MALRQYKKLELAQEFFSILFNKQITTHFQAIVSFKNGEILGYEALSRGPEGSWFHRPDQLFEYARQIEKVWELDLLCRSKAISKASECIGDKKLFLNVDPDSIQDPKFKRGFTREYLKNSYMHTSSIIMEMTEKTAVKDYCQFTKLLANYSEQGYGIAIDDAGSGYSGLRLVAATRPDYLKIDMDLVRNVDKDMVKRELLKSIQKFSSMTGIKTVAEGIETWDEAKTLMELGVNYGQGYWLQRPGAEMMEIGEVQRNTIISHAHQLAAKRRTNGMLTAKDIGRFDRAIQSDATCSLVSEWFSENDNLQGIAVVKGDQPVGLIMRTKYYYIMEKRGREDDFLNRKALTVADQKPLFVSQETQLDDLCRMAMARNEHQLYDYLLVHNNMKYVGVIPVALLLDTLNRTMEEQKLNQVLIEP